MPATTGHESTTIADRLNPVDQNLTFEGQHWFLITGPNEHHHPAATW
jgi:hypothetical protein